MGGRNLEPKLPSVPNSQENSEMSLSRELRSPYRSCKCCEENSISRAGFQKQEGLAAQKTALRPLYSIFLFHFIFFPFILLVGG